MQALAQSIPLLLSVVVFSSTVFAQSGSGPTWAILIGVVGLGAPLATLSPDRPNVSRLVPLFSTVAIATIIHELGILAAFSTFVVALLGSRYWLLLAPLGALTLAAGGALFTEPLEALTVHIDSGGPLLTLVLFGLLATHPLVHLRPHQVDPWQSTGGTLLLMSAATLLAMGGQYALTGALTLGPIGFTLLLGLFPHCPTRLRVGVAISGLIMSALSAIVLTLTWHLWLPAAICWYSFRHPSSSTASLYVLRFLSISAAAMTLVQLPSLSLVDGFALGLVGPIGLFAASRLERS